MLTDLFNRVLDGYKNDFKNAQREDPNFLLLKRDIPHSIKDYCGFRNDLLIVGSCGTGQKTDYPWVAIFNKRITTSATKGLYMVYLFKKDMTGFYLSLNQGITFFERTFGKKKYDTAREVANYFKQEINDNYFDRNDIDLGASRGTLGFGYQETNIVSKHYEKGKFNDNLLEQDFKKMLSIYDELVGVLGETNYNYNEAIQNLVQDSSSLYEKVDEAIDNIKKIISSPTDLNTVRSLKYVEPKEKRTKRYEKIRNKAIIKKVDYIEKAKADMEVGQLGEMLALQYEKEQLIQQGYSEYAEKVRRVSIKSDAFGYDIISYKLGNDMRMREIYIEVKTTNSKLDVDFPVSRGEVEESNNKKNNYCVFRIYDAKDPNPSFYKVFGKIEDHFELDPITYLARYVGNKAKAVI